MFVILCIYCIIHSFCAPTETECKRKMKHTEVKLVGRFHISPKIKCLRLKEKKILAFCVDVCSEIHVHCSVYLPKVERLIKVLK